MDRLQKGFFRMAAELKYLKLKRQEFQWWFGCIMEKAHPTDYENIRLTQGDGGLDGIRISSGTAYAVYAPREMSEGEVVAKMNNDFAAANRTMEQQGATLQELVFVHNDEGLTKVTGPALIRLQQDNPGIRFVRWAFEAIWRELERLTAEQLEELFGPGPTVENVARLGFPAIQEVIRHLSRAEVPAKIEITLPSPDKLEHNQLSALKADMLRMGRHRQGLVGQYLDGLTVPTTGEKIAEAFREKYDDLKQSGMTPDEIFTGLWSFSGGDHFTAPDHVAAVTAVMAYFFSSCDIFDNAPVAS